MRHWRSKIDDAITKAMKEGQLDKLPGAGKPLNLFEDPNVPEDQRLAYRVLKANDMAPEWIELGKVLEKKKRDLITKLKKLVTTEQNMMAKAEIAPSQQRYALRQNAKDYFRSGKKKLNHLVDEYNRMITDYNLKVPTGVEHRYYFSLEQEINRLRES